MDLIQKIILLPPFSQWHACLQESSCFLTVSARPLFSAKMLVIKVDVLHTFSFCFCFLHTFNNLRLNKIILIFLADVVCWEFCMVRPSLGENGIFIYLFLNFLLLYCNIFSAFFFRSLLISILHLSRKVSLFYFETYRSSVMFACSVRGVPEECSVAAKAAWYSFALRSDKLASHWFHCTSFFFWRTVVLWAQMLAGRKSPTEEEGSVHAAAIIIRITAIYVFIARAVSLQCTCVCMDSLPILSKCLIHVVDLHPAFFYLF